MRFLHTGDWHVGKMLKGRDRLDEHERALAEIIDIARRERVDALLIGGDIFDSYAPLPEAERLVYMALAECVGMQIPVVAISGNHDHPRRLAALERLLNSLNIFMRADPRRPDAGGIVDLPSRDGRDVAKIAVLPFVSEPKIVDACRLFDSAETWFEAYGDRVAQMMGALAQSFSADTVNILLAHVFVSGGRVGGGERPLHLGQVYAVMPQGLPAAAQYIGLNHLHRQQRVEAAAWTEYSGSTLQLDFGEADNAKRVVLIDAAPGHPVDVHSLPLSAGRRLIDISGTLDELRAWADELRGAFLRVDLHVPAPEPGLVGRVKEILPGALEVRLVYPRLEPLPEAPAEAFALDEATDDHHDGVEGDATVREGEEPRRRVAMHPTERLRAYYRRERGAELPQAIADLFERLYEETLASETD